MSLGNIQIAGAIQRTQAGDADWYYGGDDVAWTNLDAAKGGVPSAIRAGKTVGILIGGKTVEYWWPDPANVADGDLVIKEAALPQPLATTDSPTFAGLNITGNDPLLITTTGTSAFAPFHGQVTNYPNGTAKDVFVFDVINIDGKKRSTRLATGSLGTGQNDIDTELFLPDVRPGNPYETLATLSDVNDVSSGQSQATESSRGTAQIASNTIALAATDDQTIMTPLKTATYLADQKKNYFRSIAVSRGSIYENEVLLYFPTAGSITSIVGINLTNMFYKTSSGGTYTVISTPITTTTNMSLYIKFDFADTTNLNGNIAITGRDN